MGNLKTLTIIFSEKITIGEIGLFRGAVINKLPERFSLLHNHVENSFRYSYPLVQYKRIRGFAAIVAIGEGTEIFRNLNEGDSLELQIGRSNPRSFHVMRIFQGSADFLTGDDPIRYSIKAWLPLNQQNHSSYCRMESLVEQISMLEKILTGNILSAAKGLGHHIDRHIECRITSLRPLDQATYKGIPMISYDADFTANILLPPYIGLGKGTAKGFGTIL